MSRVLVYVSLIATLALGAHAEYKVGVFVGLDGELVWGLTLAMALPVAIDCYVLAALLADRDVPVALAVLALSIGGGHVYIGAAENDVAKALTGGAVGLLLVAVLWRVEELAKADADNRRRARDERDAALEASSPVATSPAPGEAQTTGSGAGGTPPADPPRSRSTKTAKKTTPRPGKHPLLTQMQAAEAYVEETMASGKKPSARAAQAYMREHAGSGMRDEDFGPVFRDLVAKHAKPALHAVSQEASA